MSARTSAASPKIASPGRVRHNPYASSPSGTPQDASALRQTSTSFSESFGSMPPATPPMATAPPAEWSASTGAAPQAFTPYEQQQNTGGDMGYGHMGGYGGDAPAFYDAVDPNVAVMMYNAASAAAANAAAARPQYDSWGQQQQQSNGHLHQRQERSGGRGRDANTSASMAGQAGANAVPRFEDLEAMGSSLIEQARTASGSSCIQAAVKDSQDPRCIELVWSVLAPCLGDLLLDAHGCYVIKTLLERLPAAEVTFVLNAIARDEQLGFSICTHSLHTRRVVQHIIETIDGDFLCELMSRHCAEVAMTQQGCIVMQRSMDNAPEGPARDALFEAISRNLASFAKDPFANYVVQHLMEVGDRSDTAGAMWKAFRGRIVELACNKFASNVIEKCLFHCTAEVQHEMLLEMYSVGPQMLFSMLQDSFGNYIIQSSIALATFRDVSLIDDALRPVLSHTPYGHKIEARLERRLKGKPVTARGPQQSGASVATTSAVAPAAQPQQRRGRGKGAGGNRASAVVPAGETAW